MPKDIVSTFRRVLDLNNFVVLDTETTGLEYPAEICQIALLDFMGNEIFNQFVKTKRLIPSQATKIHGITNDMVASAPSWADTHQQIIDLISGKHVIVYNAVYDYKILSFTDKVSGLSSINYSEIASFWCAMKFYSQYRGERDDYHGNYRWHRLGDACRYEGIPVVGDHDALGDCRLTYQLIRKVVSDMAAAEIAAAVPRDYDAEGGLSGGGSDGD